jgi:hypothetical protein
MASDEVNLYDQLVGACADPDAYPTKILRTQLLSHRLQIYDGLLQQRQKSVFRSVPKHPMIFWDCYDGNDGKHRYTLLYGEWLPLTFWKSSLPQHRNAIASTSCGHICYKSIARIPSVATCKRALSKFGGSARIVEMLAF